MSPMCGASWQLALLPCSPPPTEEVCVVTEGGRLLLMNPEREQERKDASDLLGSSFWAEV